MSLELRPATRVPEETAYFWIIKVLTTGIGRPSRTSLFNDLVLAIMRAAPGTLH